MRPSLLPLQVLLLVPGALFSQTTSLLLSQYPAANQTGVPRNAAIAFTTDASVGFFSSQVTLRQAGSSTNIPLVTVSGWTDQKIIDIALRPTTPLANLTTYTVTLAAPLLSTQFSFTTGTDLDTTPPRLLSVSPDPATATDPGGPFQFHFDKPLLTFYITTTAANGAGNNVGDVLRRLSADRRTFEVRLQPQYLIPKSLTISLDPRFLQDMAGNTGSPVTAQFLTTAATGTTGPHPLGTYPENGATNIPTNAAVQILFDHQILDTSARQGGIVLEARGQPVAATPQSISSSYGLVILRGVSLLPNTAYRVRFTNQLMDADGFGLNQPSAFDFTTGDGPLAPAATQTVFSPAGPGPSPTNTRLAIRAPQPMPAFAPLLFSSIGPYRGGVSDLHLNLPASAVLSDDRRTLVITPRDPLPPRQSLNCDLTSLTDITGATVASSLTVDTSDGPDTTPPQLLANTPEGGDSAIPTNIAIRALFNEELGLDTIRDAVRLRQDGALIDGRGSISGAFLDFTPSSPLDPGKDFVLEVSGVVDLAGNPAPSATLTFHTAADSTPPPGSFQLIRSSLSADAPSPADPIELQFSAPLRGGHTTATVSLIVSRSGNSPLTFACPSRVEVAGDTIRIIPLLPWPSARDITLTVSTQDLWGRFANFTTTFHPTAGDDTRPEVVSIDPAPGTPLPSPQLLRVTFSKPMLAASAVNSGVLLTQSDSTISTAAVWSDDRQTLILPLNAVYTSNGYSSAPFSLVLTAYLTDLAGNPLKPVVAQFPALPAYNNSVRSLPTIVASWPARDSGLDPRAPITLFLSVPVDAAIWNRNVFFYSPQGRVPGSWSVSSDGLLATFHPDAPWPANSAIRLLQLDFVLDVASGWGISTPAGPSPVLTLLRSTSVSPFPANAAIDLEFNQEPPTGANLITLRSGPNGQIPVVCDETRPRARVRRCTPRTPLVAGDYMNLSVRADIAGTFNGSVSSTQIGSALPADPVTLRFRSPLSGATGVPRNARISVVFSQLLNPVSVNETTVRVSSSGTPLLVQFSTQRNVLLPLTITPLEPLPANQTIDITLAGVEDPLGRLLAPVTWSFQTGAAIDRTAPNLLFTDVPGSGAVPGFDPQAPLRLTFDEPLDPAALAINFTGSAFDFSPDLRTVFAIPPGGWPRGQSFNFSANATDWSGNISYTPAANFLAGFDTDPTPLAVRAVSLHEGQTNVPINVRFGVLFNKPVGADASTSIRLMRDGMGDDQRLPLRAPAGGNTGQLTVRPQVTLDPLTDYQLVIDGVPGSAAQTIHFRTGEQYEIAAPAIVSRSLTNIGQPLKLRFAEPIDITGILATSAFLTWRDPNGYLRVEPSTAAWADDTLELTITPLRTLQNGTTYTLDLTGIANLAGLPLTTLTFTPADNPGPSALQITVQPPDGSSGVPTNVQMQLLFSRLVTTPPIRLFEADHLVQTVTPQTANPLRISRALLPNTQYRIEIAGFRDDFGNDIAPVISTFTTGALADFSSFGFVSASPANNAAGVAGNTPWQLTFNKTLSPLVALQSGPSSSRNIPFRWATTVNGKELDFTPSPEWPAASTIGLTIFTSSSFGFPPVSDWTGNVLRQQVNLSFRTAAVNDPVPPVLEAVDPPAGTLMPGGPSSISLRFSKPVGVFNNGLQLFYGATGSVINGVRSADLRTITFSVSPPGNSRISVIGTDLRDNADNQVDPFVLEYPTGDSIATGNPSASMTEPVGSNTAPGTGITIRFDRIMNSDSVLQSLHVTQDGLNVSGSITVLESGRSYRFLPRAPFTAGATVRVFILPTALDLQGRSFLTSFPPFAQFTIAPTQRTPSILQYSFPATAHTDAVLQVEFDSELDLSSVNDESVWLRAGSALVPGRSLVRDGRILEFLPDRPLTPGTEYVLTAGAAVTAADGRAFPGMDLRFRAVPAGPTPELQSVEWSQWQGRAAIRVRFSQPVSPIDARNIRLEHDGSAHAAQTLVSLAADEVWLLPDSPAPDIGRWLVTLDRVRARNGRALSLPPQTVVHGASR